MNVNRWLALIVLLYVGLGVAYAVVVPLGEAPDEVDHYLYVRHLVDTGTFPVMQPVAADNVTMEANQPPLFYLLNAALNAPIPLPADADFPLNDCFVFDPDDPGRANFYLHSQAEQPPFAGDFRAFYLARLVSVVMGMGTVWLAFVLARQMAPSRPFVWLLAAALLAFNPQFLFITASVNNDVLTALLGAAIVAGSVAAVTRPSTRWFALLGVLVGLGLLTKFALLAFWPLPVLAVLMTAVKTSQYRRTVGYGLWVIGVPLLLAGWWYGRAAWLYGDPLAWEVHLQAKGGEVLRTSPLVLADLKEFVLIHFQSYWGWFGWLRLQLPDWVYAVIGVVVIVGAAGVVWRVLSGGWRVASDEGRVAVLFNLLAVAAIYLSLLRYIQTINWSGYQGRLAFAAAGPIAGLLAWGLAAWRKREKSARSGDFLLFAGVGGFFLLLAVGAMAGVIRPSYPRPDLYQPTADLPRSCSRVAGVEIQAVSVAETKVGGMVAAEAYLYGLAAATAVPWQVEAVAADGQVVGQLEVPFSWDRGALWSSTWRFPVAEAATPGRGHIRAGTEEEMVAVAPLIIRPARPWQFLPEQRVTDAEFGGRVALTGWDREGNWVTLYWRATAVMDEDYTTFIHLLDEAGNLVAQADSQPHQGTYPTSIWRLGESVADAKQLPLGELPPGTYQVWVGLYLLETGQRLLLTDTGADAYHLTNIQLD